MKNPIRLSINFPTVKAHEKEFLLQDLEKNVSNVLRYPFLRSTLICLVWISRSILTVKKLLHETHLKKEFVLRV